MGFKLHFFTFYQLTIHEFDNELNCCNCIWMYVS